MKFLFDLLPVGLFFVAILVWDIFVATAVAIAATIAQVSLGLLRQYLKSGQQMHGIVSNGGSAPNIVTAHDTEESREGVNALKEKRKPDFRKYAK